MTQKIKLMADYQCWPLWDLQEPDNIHPAELPLSHETIERLLRWSDAYDAILNLDDPASSGFESQEAAAAFEQEGIRLWLQLRQELTPDYEVFYFSEGQHRLFSRPNELPLQNITDAQPSQYL